MGAIRQYQLCLSLCLKTLMDLITLTNGESRPPPSDTQLEIFYRDPEHYVHIKINIRLW